jgi:F-type H+-transporting ATPase subunit gamma
MASQRDVKRRIDSVKNIRKITRAMEMVAAARLRRAEQRIAHLRPYAGAIRRMTRQAAEAAGGEVGKLPILQQHENENSIAILLVTADRGLAGAFNSNIGRMTRNLARQLETEGKTVKIFAVGRKGRDYLKREMASRIIGDVSYAGRKTIGFADAQEIASRIVEMLDAGAFDVCTVVYNRFQSVIAQVPTTMRLIPAPLPEVKPEEPATAQSIYEFEPDEESMLARLLPQNLAIQIYRALLESAAGEHGARMSAMDNATRNAGDMIKRLSQNYNRARQANITRELIEIISGAEAL